ncbi:MAG: CDGSH iron-sulfur domain-containing protein [Armatimonadota bacterium]|nr:CDGSH iron-sulfur domain-containing protein [Armatimonadota bacterium]MDR7439701.1 CDGSH iron-sulfur domain-containing protein [Armatimonadota bacterium]MDR7562547.1 CDGSH iron-sulfur domain-containing protein [Armatimonadota bacterium]MDR7603029.1 CDGSH iron-sulfur domain-containing protein [Armatimonadota bacterium]
MAEVTITLRDNGPYLVRGPVRLVDAEGREWNLDREVIALCRCGGSSNKPFCDGTHARIGFQSQVRAPAS